MATMICHICLRTDITAVSLPTELVNFVDEICDFNIIENPRYKYCTICVHLLTKFYNFKQRCLKACKILKSFRGTLKYIPTNLHEQIPSSIGLCVSSARYKLLEYEETDNDLLNTTPDVNIEPNITPNNAEGQSIQNIETADSITPYIIVKEEIINDVLDSNVQTLQAADYKSLYINTKSDDNSILRSDFEEDIKCNKLGKEFNTDKRNKNVLKDNAILSKDFRSFDVEMNDNDNSKDVDDMEFKDSTFMFDNDPLRDDDSLKDIESDISDCDVKNINIDEQNAESNADSDSDADSLIEFFENIKDKKLDVSKINDLEVAKMLLKINKNNKSLQNRIKYLKGKIDLLKWFENDEYDLGDGVKISKEVFLKIFERCEKNISCYYYLKDTSDKKKTDAFLRFLLRMYNPEYETVFDIEYLDTEEKKLQEFNRRKDSAEYQGAPYRCGLCYKGFHLKQLLAYHMKQHDQSSGPHECHICSLRFHSAVRLSTHARNHHSAVYVCRLCPVTLYYFVTMKNHYDTHKGVEYRCTKCDGIFRTFSALSNHKRSHVTSHICTTCAKSFVSAFGLHLHRRYKHKDAPEPRPADAVRCTECPLTLDSQKAYEKHLKISHQTRRYICSCFEMFRSMAELRQHKVEAGHLSSENIKFRRSIAPFGKRECVAGKSKGTSGKSKGTSGKSKGTSGKSKGTSVKIKAALRTCPICQERVPNKFGSSLYWHFLENHPGEPYRAEGVKPRHLLCEECGETFAYASLLSDHKNTHLGLRPYPCGACPARFASRKQRGTHRAQHRAPHAPCHICGKSFNSWANRFNHMRRHANIRCYKCKICGAGFIYPASVREHVRGVHLRQRRVRAPRPPPASTPPQQGGRRRGGKRAASGAAVES